MALYVVMTVGFRQLGSAESKSLTGEEEVDREPKPGSDAPWPVRKGGWILKLYQNSLFICYFLLFIVSWGLHLYGSWTDHNIGQVLLHKPEDSLASFLGQPTFWFETFQNWQSEFISVAPLLFISPFICSKKARLNLRPLMLLMPRPVASAYITKV